MLGRIKNFFAEAQQELRHVNWPTRGEATRLTAVVIGISVGLALFLGLFDFIFASAIKNIVFSGTPGEVLAQPKVELGPENIEVLSEETAEPTENNKPNKE